MSMYKYFMVESEMPSVTIVLLKKISNLKFMKYIQFDVNSAFKNLIKYFTTLKGLPFIVSKFNVHYKMIIYDDSFQ